MRVTRYPKIRERIKPSLAGRLVNDLREIADVVEPQALVQVSPDPFDDYLLSIALGGDADYLVSGDKPDLLALGSYEGTKIVTVRDFVVLNRLLPP